MKRLNKKLALVVTTMALSQGLWASEQCAKEMQDKINKISKVCEKQASADICQLKLTTGCQDVLDDVNKKLISLNKSIHNQIMKADLDSAAVVKKIKEDINMSFKVASTLMSPAQAKEFKVQQEKILNQFQRLLKKDSQFLTRVHPNGMTSREIYQRFESPSYQAGVAQIFKKTMDNTQSDKNFSQDFIESFNADPELNSIAIKTQGHNGRMIAQKDGFGLHIYTCKIDSDRIKDFHIILYGMSACNNDTAFEFRKDKYSTIVEHTIGPGAYLGLGKTQALICLSYGEKFYGVGVNAGFGLMGGLGIGTYIGSMGTCLKVEATGGFGVKAGISYISAEFPKFSVANERIQPRYNEEIELVEE